MCWVCVCRGVALDGQSIKFYYDLPGKRKSKTEDHLESLRETYLSGYSITWSQCDKHISSTTDVFDKVRQKAIPEEALQVVAQEPPTPLSLRQFRGAKLVSEHNINNVNKEGKS